MLGSQNTGSQDYTLQARDCRILLWVICPTKIKKKKIKGHVVKDSSSKSAQPDHTVVKLTVDKTKSRTEFLISFLVTHS